jgi:hypothetical protein
MIREDAVMFRLIRYLPVIIPIVLKITRDPRVRKFASDQLAKRRGGGTGTGPANGPAGRPPAA